MKQKLLLILLLITFTLKLPSLFEPPWYGDEGIYLTIGQNINRGFALYRDITDNKPPLIYYLAAISGSQFIFRLIFFVIGLVSIYLFAQISKNFLATLVLILLTQTPVLEGNIPNGENLMLLPILISLFFLNLKPTLSQKHLFFIGLISGFALLAKMTSVFDIFALLFFVNFKFSKSRLNSLFFLFGSVIPFFSTSLIFKFNHTFSYFLSAVISNNFGYIGSWYTGNHTAFYLSPGLLAKSIIAILVITISLFYLKNHKNMFLIVFSVFWLALAYVGSSLSGRPYTHYLIQIAVPACLLLSQLFVKFSKTTILVCLIPFILYIFTKSRFYYQNFLLGNLADNYDSRVSSVQAISNRIRQITPNGSYLFTWTDEPYFYYLSNRLPAFSHILRYHVDDQNQRLPLISSIQKYSAAVVTSTTYPPYPELEYMLSHYYRLDYAYGPYNLYLPR